MKRLSHLPTLLLAVVSGLVTLVGLLSNSSLGTTLTAMAAFVAAVALLFGIFNLFLIHLQRAFKINRDSIYSLVLILSMLITFVAAHADRRYGTDSAFGGIGLLGAIFQNVLRPLEAALASLLAFFLLFAGSRLLRRQANGWSALFIGAAVLFLIASAPLPAGLGNLFAWVQDYIAPIFVNAGVRAILIGVALGTITLAIRLLVGLERPYSK